MRRPPRRRLPTVRLLGVALALLVVTTWGWTGGRAASQPAGDPGPTLTLVRQTDWVGPEAVFQVVLTARGLPAGATIGAELHAKVESRSTLEAAAAGDAAGDVIFRVARKPVTELTAADGTVTVSLAVTTASPPPDGVASMANAGVYPFAVQVHDAAGNQVAELVTTLLRLGAPASNPVAVSSPLAVGVVVPVRAPAVPGADDSPTLDEAGAAQLTATIGAVDEQPAVPLTLAPSPESMQLLDDQGAAGAATVSGLGTKVARQVLAGPYAPIDTGAWTGSGLLGEMDDQYASGTRTLRDLLGTPPTQRIAVLDRTVTPAALDHLRTLGVEAVVAPSGQLAPFDSGATSFAARFEIATADGTTVQAVVGDDPTAARLADRHDPVLAGHQALAELAYLRLADSEPARGVAVVVPSAADPRTLSTFLAGLADADGADSGSVGETMVSPVTLDDLFVDTAAASGNRSAELVQGYRSDGPADLGRYPALLRGARTSFGGLVSFVPTASGLTDPIDRTLLSSGARTLDAAGRDAMVAAAQGSITAATGEIVVAPEQIVTLTSSSGNVPLNLENRLPYEASVRLVLDSAKLDFPEGAVIEQKLAPAQTTTINLPVETLASGAFPLDVSITSADGTLRDHVHPLHRALHRHLRCRALPLGRRRAVPPRVVGEALPHRPPRPEAGGLEPPRRLGRRPRWLRSARPRHRPTERPTPPHQRPTPTHWRADEPRPHRHRQLVRSHPRRDHRARHRGRPPQHPVRHRGVHRP